MTRKNILISDWVDAIPAKDLNKITEEGFNKKKIGKIKGDAKSSFEKIQKVSGRFFCWGLKVYSTLFLKFGGF